MASVVHAERLPSFYAQVPSAPMAVEGGYAEPSMMPLAIQTVLAVPLDADDKGEK